MLREARKRELKEQIFLQAVQLFKERGYENVTVQQIASACGIAKGTFFNYFSKKEEILLYLGESQIELLNRSMEKHQGIEHPKEQIERVLGELLLRFTEHGELMKLAVLEIVKSTYLIENESKSILQLKQSIVAMIERAKQNGKLSNHRNSEIIASTIVSVYFHTMMSWSLHDQNSEIREIFQQHLDVVWGGIGS